LNATTGYIEGFESPLGMELFSTVDCLCRDGLPLDARQGVV